jgi:hypothetical protein
MGPSSAGARSAMPARATVLSLPLFGARTDWYGGMVVRLFIAHPKDWWIARCSRG